MRGESAMGRASRNGGAITEASWLAGGGRLAHESSRGAEFEEEDEEHADRGEGVGGASMMMTMGRMKSNGSY